MPTQKIGKLPGRHGLPLLRLILALLVGLPLCSAGDAVAQVNGVVRTRFYKFEGPNEAPEFQGNYQLSPTAVLNVNANSKGAIALRADWMGLDWLGRIAITVSNPGEPQSDFPIALTLDNRFQRLWSTLHGLDGAELRVTDSDGVTPLSFWFEDFNNGVDLTRSCANISGVVHSTTPLAQPLNLDGQTLLLRVGGIAPQTVTFSGNGLTLAQVVAQINAAGTGVSASEWRGYLRLVLPRTGEYNHETTILPSSTALGTLKLTEGIYTNNFISQSVMAKTRIGVHVPCLNLWVRLKSMPSGDSTIYLYFNNDDTNLVSLSSEQGVFSYPTPVPTQILLSDVSHTGTLFVSSFFDGTEVRLGALDGPLLQLGQSEWDSFLSTALAPGQLLYANGPIIAGLDAAFTETLMPLSFQGRRFVYPTVRGTNTFFVYAPHADTSVTFEEWFFQSSTVTPLKTQTVQLLKGERQAIVFDTTDRNPDSILEYRNIVQITSSAPVVIQHRAPENLDNHLLYPGSTDLWGIVSTKTHLGAIENGTEVTIYAGNNLTSSQTLSRGQSFSNESSNQGTGVMLHVISTNRGAPVGMLQHEDGDGNDSTTFLPYSELGKRYLIPRPAEYVTIATTWPSTTCTLRWGLCSQPSDCLAPSSCVDGRCQLAKTSGALAYPTPNTIYFGLALLPPLSCSQDNQCFDGARCVNGGCRFPLGDDGGNPATRRAVELSCTERVWAIYEDADTQQERNLFPAKAHRKVPGEKWSRVSDERFEGIFNRQAVIETPTYVAQWVVLSWLDVGTADQQPPGTRLTYQVDLGDGWRYWRSDTQSWDSAGEDLNKANSLAELQAGFSLLPNETGRIRFRVIFYTEEGDETPSIDTLRIQVSELEQAPVVTINVPSDPVPQDVAQTISGRVTATTGEPIKGLRLTFTVAGPGGSYGVVSGITDDNGEVSVTYTPAAPGTHTLTTTLQTGSGPRSDSGDLVVPSEAIEPEPDVSTSDASDTLDSSDGELPDLAVIDSGDGDDGDSGDLTPDVDAADTLLDTVADSGGVTQRRLSGTTVFGCQQGSPPNRTPLGLVLVVALGVAIVRRLRSLRIQGLSAGGRVS